MKFSPSNYLQFIMLEPIWARSYREKLYRKYRHTFVLFKNFDCVLKIGQRVVSVCHLKTGQFRFQLETGPCGVQNSSLWLTVKIPKSHKNLDFLNSEQKWETERVRAISLWQCDQIGRIFIAKVARIFSNIFGLLWKMDLFCLTDVDTFWATFGENWATFYSNI